MPDLSRVIRGRAWKFGDSIDTNQLAGGGIQFSNDPLENLKANCLRGLRSEFPDKVVPGDLLVAGTNFGCGSHRQSAVEALQLCGIQAVLAESIARIHLRNSIALALPTYAVSNITGLVNDGDTVEIDYGARQVRNLTTGLSLTLTPFPPAVEEIYQLGGLHAVIAEKLRREGIVPHPSS